MIVDINSPFVSEWWNTWDLWSFYNLFFSNSIIFINKVERSTDFLTRSSWIVSCMKQITSYYIFVIAKLYALELIVGLEIKMHSRFFEKSWLGNVINLVCKHVKSHQWIYVTSWFVNIKRSYIYTNALFLKYPFVPVN